jgi:hypothetical protein
MDTLPQIIRRVAVTVTRRNLQVVGPYVSQARTVPVLLRRLAIIALLSALAPGPAAAQWEVESDPLAYAVNGFSAHLARQIDDGRMRVQLGVFGADVPGWLHGEDGWALRARGVTLKVDYFFAGRAGGMFIGLDADRSRLRYQLRRTREASERNVTGLGPRMGYRFEFGERLYVTPWISVRYLFNARDVTLSGRRFSNDDYAIFPTVHIGWRF